MKLSLPLRVFFFLFGCANLFLAWAEITERYPSSPTPWFMKWPHAAIHLMVAGGTFWIARGRQKGSE
jgi:hypothetical protein